MGDLARWRGWAEVDLAAIRHNAAVLARAATPARLCAVVKANGYGHGAVPVARAALAGGAQWLAVALVEEGAELREAGIGAPVLLLAEPPAPDMHEALALGLTPTLYTTGGVQAAARAARLRGSPAAVHVKVDTGMHRVGADADVAVDLAAAVQASPWLTLGGFWTHLAVADEPDNDFTAQQVRRFEAALARLKVLKVEPSLVHAANSAGALAHPAARYGLVRCGIAVYGHAPSPELAGLPAVGELRPALALKARVTLARELDAGEGVSYGLAYRLARRSTVATVPLGYADGVTRRLWARGGEVLIGGRRCPVAGTVTMDQLMVDCGTGASVAPGDEVVLIGTQGGEEIAAAEWAARLETITYEVLCGIGPRVPRVHVGEMEEVAGEHASAVTAPSPGRSGPFDR